MKNTSTAAAASATPANATAAPSYLRKDEKRNLGKMNKVFRRRHTMVANGFLKHPDAKEVKISINRLEIVKTQYKSKSPLNNR